MEKYKRNNLRAVMGLSALLCLTGCGEENKSVMYLGYQTQIDAIYFSSFDDEITYNGMISYDNLEKGTIKIVTLKQGDVIYEPKLMGVYLNKVEPMYAPSYSDLYYIDFESRISLIQYHWNSLDTTTKPTVERGESLEIVEEENLFYYVFQSGWLEEEYPIDELIAFYNEKVRENRDNKELELTY